MSLRTPQPKPRGAGKRLRFLLGALFLTLLAGYLVMSTVLALSTTSHGPVTLTVPATSIGTDFESVAFPSRADRVTLRGWLFHAAKSNGRSVVLVHGWQANRSSLAPQARDFVARGYDALLFDTRGSGESSGNRQTLGNLETRDVLGAYDFMTSRGYVPAKMAMLGQSQGAAALIEAAPMLSDVGALISDSAYAELGPLLQQRFTVDTTLPGWLDFAGANIARLFGLDPDLRPVDIVANLPQRAFLFLHAANDTLIPVSNARELKAASVNPKSALLVLPGNGHVAEYAANSKVYMADVDGFINSQIPK